MQNKNGQWKYPKNGDQPWPNDGYVGYGYNPTGHSHSSSGPRPWPRDMINDNNGIDNGAYDEFYNVGSPPHERIAYNSEMFYDDTNFHPTGYSHGSLGGASYSLSSGRKCKFHVKISVKNKKYLTVIIW